MLPLFKDFHSKRCQEAYVTSVITLDYELLALLLFYVPLAQGILLLPPLLLPRLLLALPAAAAAKSLRLRRRQQLDYVSVAPARRGLDRRHLLDEIRDVLRRRRVAQQRAHGVGVAGAAGGSDHMCGSLMV